ncbi:helix-turn-helix domain-containing protein [Mesorhizobium sp. M0700]|uniref:helix-turn-helix domain-containing protein n=1 Tax=Mesorhizobium sp. M0700 TaxID=2956988 RepID=UPI00333606CE
MSSGPRYSIIPADAVFDNRLSRLALHVLTALGTHSDSNGWCIVKQNTLANEIGSTPGSVQNAVRQLAKLGYLRKRDRFAPNGAKLASQYQVAMDRDPPAEMVDEAAETATPTPLPDGVVPHSHVGRHPTPTWGHKNDPYLERSSSEDIEKQACLPVRACRLPDNFAPDVSWATGQGMSPADVSRERERFFDHWRAAPGQRGVKRDWQATWRNWVRNALDRHQAPQRRALPAPRAPDGLFALCQGELSPTIAGDGHVIEH